MSSKLCASSLRTGSLKPKRTERGFTLLELLVALGVFALISAIAYRGLDSLLSLQAHSDADAARLAAFQLAFMHLERDLSQFVTRSIRDEYGVRQEALHGDMTRLEFTRAGWANSQDHARGNLQRVTYYFQDKRLYRGYWPVLDRAPQTPLLNAVLLENLTSLSFHYLSVDPNPLPQWPPYANAAARLKAVEIRLESPEWGQIRRLFLVPGG
jgi:general secretion pathway protein J